MVVGRTGFAEVQGVATVSRIRKTEILALGSLPKWASRCSGPECSAACAGRGGFTADSRRIHGGFMADSWRIHGGFMANGFAKFNKGGVKV
jgi:hypothetical protein